MERHSLQAARTSTALIVKARSELDEDKRKALYHDMAVMVRDEGGIDPAGVQRLPERLDEGSEGFRRRHRQRHLKRLCRLARLVRRLMQRGGTPKRSDPTGCCADDSATISRRTSRQAAQVAHSAPPWPVAAPAAGGIADDLRRHRGVAWRFRHHLPRPVGDARGGREHPRRPRPRPPMDRTLSLVAWRARCTAISALPGPAAIRSASRSATGSATRCSWPSSRRSSRCRWRSASACSRCSSVTDCPDKLISLLSLAAISLPEFFIGYLLILFFAVKFGDRRLSGDGL